MVSVAVPCTFVSLKRVSAPAGVMRKAMVLVDVTVLAVSFSIRMIFSKAVDAVSGSRTNVAVAVPLRVVLLWSVYRVELYQVPVSLMRAVAGIGIELLTTSYEVALLLPSRS